MESLLGNMMLTYKKGWKKHFFDALALAELQKETYTGFYTTVTNFNTDKFGYNNLQAGALRLWEGTNSYYEQPHLASFMGRFNYTYADRYSLTVNARTDASSKFGANHKWGFFPSVSAAWVISEEKFMKRLPIIDNLKFRIGYGLAGNQSGIDSYTTLSLVKPNGVIPVGNSAAVSLGRPAQHKPRSEMGSETYLQYRYRPGYVRQPPAALRQLLQLQDDGHALPLQRQCPAFHLQYAAG